MVFYHGTSENKYKEIMEEGVLYGKRGTFNGREIDRCTYLAVDKEEAECYGDVLLEVEYDPFKNKKKNNYIEDCWQIRVYEPIAIANIKRIEKSKPKRKLRQWKKEN